MKKPFRVRVWKVALAAVAATATAMALYVQLFELRSREEESRLWAARLESMLAESRVRLRAEILAEIRAELARGGSPEEPDARPVPNAVLRRGESGGALGQVLDSRSSQETVLAGLQGRLDALADQMERSDRALRRDSEELRAEIRRSQNVFGKTSSLLGIAMIPLVIHLVASLRASETRARDEDEDGASSQAQTKS